MSLSILGLGTAVPEHKMSQLEATELAKKVICQTEQQSRLLEVLYRKSGVENRHTVLPHRIAMNWLPPESGNAVAATEATTLGPTTGERMNFYAEHAGPLATRAVQSALDKSGIDPQQVTHVITVTCTGFTAPGVDIDLINNLGFRRTTQRVQVGYMGCHGAINGLRVAQALATSDPHARVVLCAVELCSLHYRFCWDPERIVANALFADGAAALVGGGSGGDSKTWRVLATGSCLMPDSADAMTWRIGDHGFEMTLNARVPDLIRQHLRPWLSAWLDQQGHSLDSIGAWAIHPGGPRILNAIEDSLGLTRESTAVSCEILTHYGNMSSPTALFIVQRLFEQSARLPCLVLGFGPGLVAEAALIG